MTDTRKEYLAAEVMTAPPQKLHLMVIEAALRAAHRAAQQWQEGRDDEALESLLHAQECVNELLCGMNRDGDPELVRQLTALYLFVFRALVEAGLHRDRQKLAEAVRVLEIEQETWRQLCTQLAQKPAAGAQASPPALAPIDWPVAGGLSLEA